MRVTFRYEQTIPHATYLLTMVAGEFSEIAQTHPRLPVAYYVEPGREADGERSFGRTPQMIDAFEAAVGVRYPYARYSQIAVADFIFGGMENTSATTQTDRTLHDERAHLDFSSEPLVAHELAHQWFGDLVTCRDWSQAWLNEGFATYFETVWMEASRGWDEYQRAVFDIVEAYLDEDGERYRRPIVCNVYRDPIELFDRHLYEKGGAVLHMLRGELGWERMKRALRQYVTDNATRSVETIDLVRAIERATGRNVREFFAQWIERGGHPELEVRASWDGERSALTFEVEQKQTIDDEHPPYVFDFDLGLVTSVPGGDRVRRRRRSARGRAARAPARLACARVVRHRRSGEAGADPDRSRRLRAVHADVRARHRVARAPILRGDPSPGRAHSRRPRAGKRQCARGRTRRCRRRCATNRFGAWPSKSQACSAKRVRRMRAPRCSRDARTRTRRCAAPSRRRSERIATPKLRRRCLSLRDDASYFVAGSALSALGKTRDERAFEALVAALGEPSWNETIAGRRRARSGGTRRRASARTAVSRRPAGSRRTVAAGRRRRAGPFGYARR